MLQKIPKLTPMVRLGNRTYRVWGNIELPKYFIKLHSKGRRVRRKSRIFTDWEILCTGN